MPAEAAWYVSSVARAVPSLPEWFIRYWLPQEQGWSYVHCLQLERGLDVRWQRAEHNPDVRWWNRVVSWLRRT